METKGKWEVYQLKSNNVSICAASGDVVAVEIASLNTLLGYDTVVANAALIREAVNACFALDNEQPLMVSYFIRDNIDTLRGLYENYKHRLSTNDKGKGMG